MIEAVKFITLDYKSKDAGLAEQHIEYMREGYDGHNVRPHKISAADLRHRRNRRGCNCWLRQLVIDWNCRKRVLS